jgi:hypothetical protein
MIQFIIAFIFLSIGYYFYSRRQISGRPPIIYGTIPYFGVIGDLNLPYLKEMQKKHGNIFTLYIMGKFYTVLFDEKDIKEYSLAKEENLSFIKFYDFLIQDFTVSFNDSKVNHYIKKILGYELGKKLIHKFVNKKENLDFLLKTQKKITMKKIEDWKKLKSIDIFEESKRYVAEINLEQFIGHSSKSLIDDVLETDPSVVVEKRALSSIIRNKLGLQTIEKKCYQNIGNTLMEIIKKRETDDNKERIPFDEIIEFTKENGIKEIDRWTTAWIHGLVFAAQLNTTMLLSWSIYRLFDSNDDEL